MQKEKYISIGKITKAIGLKGYVKVLVLTDFPERYSDLQKARLYSEKEGKLLRNGKTGKDEFEVNDVIFDRDFIKMQFRDFEDINLTGCLIGCSIVIEESERKELEDGKYYFYEMVGMDIINEGEKIGRLESIENYGAQDLLKIKLEESNKEILIPFIEDFIKNVDTKERKIYIEVIDGMLN